MLSVPGRVDTDRMRELIYVSRRKLSQFQADAKPKRRRVRDFGVTAPLGMGGIQLGLADQTPPDSPSLGEVVQHLEHSGDPLRAIDDPAVKAGDWVRFAAMMTYHVFRDYKPGYEPQSEFYELSRRERGLFRPHLGDRTALLFWNPMPEAPWIPDSESPDIHRRAPQPTRLLLHGAPVHLVGSSTPPSSDWPQRLAWGGSHPTFLFDLLQKGPEPIFPHKPGDRVPFSSHLDAAFRELDTAYPPSLAFSQAGIALVSVVIEETAKRFKGIKHPGTSLEKTVTNEFPAWRAVIASPLYVERVNSTKAAGDSVSGPV